MLTPEFFLAIGIILICGSLIALYVAQAVRGWFFPPEPKVELAPVRSERKMLGQPQRQF
jgi:hypothetical protein